MPLATVVMGKYKKNDFEKRVITKKKLIYMRNLTTKELTTMSLVILMFLFGCRNEELKTDEIETSSYLKKYMNYPSKVYPSWSPSENTYVNCNSDYMSQDTISIDYKDNKISKRIGYLIQFSPNTGFLSVFTKDIYDTLIYTNNQLTILTKSKSQYISGVTAFKKVIYYENARISKTVQSYENKSDITVYYTYSNNLLTKKTGYNGTDLYFQSDFYYNTNGNLDSIISRKSKYNYNTDKIEIDFSSKDRIKEVFENYDNSKNQLKPFIVFDETFNRSLSENNYAKYNYYYFDINGNMLNEWHYTYNLKYENGVVNFAK